MNITDWLRSIGLERYEAAFRENEIDETVLPTVTAEDLKDLGVDVVDTVVSCSMPSPCCALTRTPKRRQPKLRQHSPLSLLKTAPSAAKSR